MMLDSVVFCKHLYASQYLPVACFRHTHLLFSAGFPDDVPLYQSALRQLLAMPHNPAVLTASDTGLYGIVHIIDSPEYILLGPAYSGTVTQDILRTYMSNNAIPKEKEQNTAQFLSAIPRYTYNRFLNLF